MSDKSPFKQFQDTDGDGLVDKCIPLPTIDQPCPPCTPNPNAIIPNWKTNDHLEVFLNERTCEYWCTVRSDYQDTGGIDSNTPDEILRNRAEEYKTAAIEAILMFAGKETEVEVGFEQFEPHQNIADADAVVDYHDWFLDVVPNSRLRFLFVANKANIDMLEDVLPDSTEPEAPTKVEYNINAMRTALIHVSKGLRLYNRYLAVYKAVDGGKAYHTDSGKEVDFQQVAGNRAMLGGGGRLREMMPELRKFLWTQGWTLTGTLQIGWGRYSASDMKIGFNDDFTIKFIKVWEPGCKDFPHVIKGNKLRPLTSKSAFKDKTALAYLAFLFDAERDLLARAPKPWVEFIKEYTYPGITIIEPEPGVPGPLSQAVSCVADNFNKDIEDLGQELIGEVFGLGDAIAYKFRDAICSDSDDVKAQLKDLGVGTVYDPNTGTNKPMYMYARDKAFQQMEDDDIPFTELCDMLLGTVDGMGGRSIVDNVWKGGFDKLKWCGMADLLLEVIKCLFGGLSMEEALASVIRAALKAMDLASIGNLFVGLPPEKQEEIAAVVERRLKEGDVPGFDPEKYEPEKAPVKPPWEDPEIMEQVGQNPASSTVDGIPPPYGQESYTPQRERRTLAQQFDVANAVDSAKQNMQTDNILHLYLVALLEVYEDSLLDLIDELNKFPGAQIIAAIIALIDCPRQPLFDPSIMDFLKSVELPWCRKKTDLVMPRINNPLAWLPSIWNLIQMLIKIIIQEIIAMVVRMIMAIIIKICTMLGNAICKALEVVGDLAAGLPSVITGRNTFSEIIRDALCGEGADPIEVEQTVYAIFGQLGNAGAGMANQDTVMEFTQAMSGVMTNREMVDLILGEPTPRLLGILHELVELDHPEFSAALGSPGEIGAFFAQVGNLLPIDFRNELRQINSEYENNMEVPVNPSLCATPETLAQFEDARCALLDGRATKEQCDKLYDDLRDDLINDLDDVARVLQTGLDQYIAENMPPIMSTPGAECQDGFFPMLTESEQSTQDRVISRLYEVLKVAYAHDLIGNGPFDRQWGMINLVLSDVNALAFTTHQRKSANKWNYVDFYGENDAMEEIMDAYGLSSGGGGLFTSMLNEEKGAFPVDIAGWLQDYIMDEKYIRDDQSGIFNVDNSWKGPRWKKWTIKVAGKDETYRVRWVGYKKSDIKAKFRDNAKGRADDYNEGLSTDKANSQGFAWGFNLNMSLSDCELHDPIEVINTETGETMTDPGWLSVKQGDWTTLRLYEAINPNYSDAVIRKEKKGSGNSDVVDPTAEAIEKAMEDGGAPYNIAIALRQSPGATSPHTVVVEESLPVDVTDMIESFPPPVMRGINGMDGPAVMPQVHYLTEYINARAALSGSPGVAASSVQSSYETTMETIVGGLFKTIAEGGEENPAFSFGAIPDILTPLDLMYVNPFNYTEYDDDGNVEQVHKKDDPYTIPNSEGVIGKSFTRNPRVHFLDPAIYGGTYNNPQIYVSPPTNDGWLGFLDILIPEYDACKPRRTDLVDFEDITDRVNELMGKLPLDERLKSNPDCVVELPYNRILDPGSAANIEGTIMAAMRMFGSVAMIKAMATFTKFKGTFPDNFSGIFSGYVLQQMEERFKDTSPFLGIGMFKDERFWYAFLEQCVQVYARRVDMGEIEDPPVDAIRSLRRLNDLQQSYDFPYKEELRNAKATDEIQMEKEVGFLMNLKHYRNLKNLQAVKDTEMDAKNVAKHLMNEQLTWLGEKFASNLESINMAPQIQTIGEYILSAQSGMCAGSALNLNQELVEYTSWLPQTAESDLYTAGGELMNPDGSEYIGEYHVHYDAEGDYGPAGYTVAMAGAEHVDSAHDVLTLVARLKEVRGKGTQTEYDGDIIVEPGEPMGDVAEFGSTVPTSDGSFVIEKYMRITPKEALGITPEVSLTSLVGTAGPQGVVSPTDWNAFASKFELQNYNLSAFYGNLELIYPDDDDTQIAIGVKGSTGVRYGLRLSWVTGGAKQTLMETEVDVVDDQFKYFEPLKASSKALHCVISNMINSFEFKFLFHYAFPFQKFLAYVAIYNSEAFFPSIGQLTEGEDDDPKGMFDKASPPGRQIDPDSGRYIGGTRGWEPMWKRAKLQRFPNVDNWFAKSWDEWDQQTLTLSTQRIRAMFVAWYKIRDFDYDDETGAGSAIKEIFKNLREELRPSPGKQHLPWYKKGKLTGRPFNKFGDVCDKGD